VLNGQVELHSFGALPVEEPVPQPAQPALAAASDK
jgi:hypothetical protein